MFRSTEKEVRTGIRSALKCLLLSLVEERDAGAVGILFNFYYR